MSEQPAIIRGVPLEEEPGLGALTLPGFLAEVRERYGPREALVTFEGDAATARWTYDELWERANEVARALIACGLGKGEYVGMLMTNRLEWVSSCFGIAMAGGVAVGLSTFSTPDELEALLRHFGGFGASVRAECSGEGLRRDVAGAGTGDCQRRAG